MPNLTVPKPKFDLKPEDYVGSLVKVDKPIKVECGKVKYPGGSVAGILETKKFGFYVYREESGQIKIWDKSVNAWKMEAGVTDKNKEFNMLMYDDKDLNIPWKGLLVAMGEKYLNKSNGIFYKYFIKCYF
jgi:hypothetical protein